MKKKQLFLIVIIALIIVALVFGILKMLDNDKNIKSEDKKINDIKSDNSNDAKIILELSSKYLLEIEEEKVINFYEIGQKKAVDNSEYKNIVVSKALEKIIKNYKVSNITLSLYEGDINILKEIEEVLKKEKIKTNKKELTLKEKSNIDKEISVTNIEDKNSKDDKELDKNIKDKDNKHSM